MRTRHALLASALVLASAPPVFANSEAGERVYHAGIEAYTADSYPVAKARFEAALVQLVAGHPLRVQALYSLARVEEEMDDPCAAAGHFADYLRLAPRDEPAEVRHVKRAKRDRVVQRKRCEARVEPPPQLAVELPPAPPEGRAAPPVARRRVEAVSVPARHGPFVTLSIGEGFVIAGGVNRTQLSPELAAGYRWGDVQAELGGVLLVEKPLAVIARPGARLTLAELGANSIYLRGALQLMLTPLTTAGLLATPGIEVPLGWGWALDGEVGASLWLVAPSLVPVEARIGIRRAL